MVRHRGVCECGGRSGVVVPLGSGFGGKEGEEDEDAAGDGGAG